MLKLWHLIEEGSMKKFGLISLMVLSLAACATPQLQSQIVLKPQVEVESMPLGQGKTVAVTVLDKRDQNSESNAKIDSSQNISQIVSVEINKGLKKYGFNPVPITSQIKTSNQLTVEIQSIDYRSMKSLVASNAEVFVAAKVTATSALGSYSKVYNASSYSDTYLKKAKQDSTEEVNAVFNQLLNNILNDAMLIQFLGK
jgi:uncharacterized lipoprotein YajG